MLADQRRVAILDLVRERGGASVADLSAALAVSASTIRRDLDALHTTGKLQRVRGGGTAEVEIDVESFATVAGRAAGDKDRIGACAAALVPERAVVILDIGTTCAAVARHLRGREVTVVTASLAVVDELRDDRSIELVVLGGLLRPSYLSLVGSITLDVISRLNADISFIGTSGVRADGTVLDSTGTEVPIKHAIMERSERRCLVASTDKFPGSGLLPVCGVDDFTDIVTTAPGSISPLAQLGGRVDVRAV